MVSLNENNILLPNRLARAILEPMKSLQYSTKMQIQFPWILRSQNQRLSMLLTPVCNQNYTVNSATTPDQ